MSNENHESKGNNLRFASVIVGWGIVTFVWVILICMSYPPLKLSASFSTKVGVVVLGTLLGSIGALIGHFIKVTYVTNAPIHKNSSIWSKLFWWIGPQIIGIYIGLVVTIAIIRP